MPHSKSKLCIPSWLGSVVVKCSCGQTFEHESDRDFKMKMRMHNKFCDKLVDQKIKKQPRKAINLKGIIPREKRLS